MEGLRSPQARELEAREMGGQRVEGTTGEKGGRQQARESRRIRNISGAEEDSS